MTGTLRASPLARKLAAEKGVVLTRVRGSGHHGRILRADVLAAAGGVQRDRRAPAREPVSLARLVRLPGVSPDPLARVRSALELLPDGRGVRAVDAGSDATGDRVEVGAPRREPVLRDGRLVVGWMLPLGLTTDGRGIDPSGAEALLEALARGLEN